ncbi:zinc transporter ZIP10 [Bombina bombina]|uniref:zinc transporter ZIP10 n=1 Tax=Bombina bombina TaxID=8345 RepID=UPI00235B050B|nr:zinc transporter ZIP10 [Bombina bombina]XP_053554550.1 zinc transporter ZIP10 [Bombina bombina]XP_053554551.1 zinc transporter ZIP10 [Bombina bombina]XP_053554552.1 zinc transporter ZIP10 [Bombina bombina]
MKVHIHTKFCLICLLTFIFHHCNDCHGETHHHASEENHIQLHNDYQISEEPYLKNGAVELSTSKTLGPEILPEAEHEQKYYIEKLFHRYGEDGRLSFYGLEKLLASLGLGEVKIVEIGHEDIGHDHVSHLDALDLQEGKHIHEHNDLGSHVDLENETKTTSDYHKCDIRKTDSSESVQTKASRHTHLHHHGRDINGHLHNSSHHSHNTTGGHVEQDGQSNEPLADTNTTHEHPDQKTRKHKKRRKGKKNGETTIDSVSELGLEHSSDEAYDRNHVHKPVHDYDHSHDHNHNANHDSEEHRPVDENRHRNTQKREAPHEHINVNKFDINIISTQNQKEHGEEFHEHDECLNVSQLLHYYGLNLNSPISPEQFAYLCPALLYQIDSRFCIKHFADLQVENLEKSKAGASAWICGLISITVISLLSLLGVILIPIINQGCFKFLLNFLVALAVGTLSGDALLHLLPHSQGGHDHGTADHVHKHADEVEHVSDQTFLQEYDSVMKGLVALGGIYLLFIVEHCLHMFKHYKEQKGKQKWLKRKQKVDESSVGRKLSDHKLNRRSDAEWLQLKPVAGTIDGVTSEGQRLDETEMTYVESFQQTPMKVFVPVDEEMPHINKDGSSFDDHSLEDLPYENNHEKTDIQKKHNHSKHSHHSHGHCHSGKDMKDTGIANIAWMVIMGDGMHNFSDGLAIGAAFSAGLTGGISTSVAVFCHELPHELGDFAVLLKAGMTVNQAIVYNLLSAMMAYVGMLIGTAVGQYANNITHWIFAVTAGMFLYVALVDMLPEMLHGDEEESGHCALGQFILQNLGLLLGFAIMLVIALYEDKIVFDIQF